MSREEDRRSTKHNPPPPNKWEPPRTMLDLIMFLRLRVAELKDAHEARPENHIIFENLKLNSRLLDLARKMV